MSLFGSIYEDDGHDPDAPTPAPIEVPLDPPIEILSPDAALGGPTMSLQDFAAEVFGNNSSSRARAADLADPDGTPVAPGGDGPSGSPAGDVPANPFSALGSPPAESAGEPPAAETSSGGVATLVDPDRPAVDEPSPPEEPASAFGAFDPPVEVGGAALPVDADLLPARKPRRGPGLPSVSPSQIGRPIKLTAVVALVGLLVFVGARALAGGGEGDPAPPADPAGDAAGAVGDQLRNGALDPRNGGSIVTSVGLVATESDLRIAAVAAQAQYAETGSFALPASEWAALVGRTVVDAAAGAPGPGVLGVMSSERAVCFQTATDAGTTVAVGVTEASLGFATDPARRSICTVDAATLAGWQPSLLLP